MLTNEQRKELRKITAIATNMLILDRQKRAKSIEKKICTTPERFSEEFIRDAGFNQEKTEQLLKIRLMRLDKLRQEK